MDRQASYAIFGLGIPVMAGAPSIIHSAADGSAAAELSLAAFYGGSILAMRQGLEMTCHIRIVSLNN